MGFRKIRFYNYRNLRDAEVDVDAPEVFFVGENGQGKTNFLEAVYLLCYGASFRTTNEQLLVRIGADEMSVDGEYEPSSEESTHIQVRYLREKKEIRIDGKILKDRRELLENVPCIVFSHDDIRFVNGSPEARRIFFNQTLILYDHTFVDSLRIYNRILRSRNFALKEQKNDLLDVYDIQLINAGREIIEKRIKVTEAFNLTFSRIFREISGLEYPLTVRYVPSWRSESDTDEIISLIKKRRNTDLNFGVTTSGPHRDRFIFSQEGSDFSKIASTGQLRLISLILKAAQAMFFRERTGRKPLLLLDDVLLELDLERRRKFLLLLPEYEQAFFTFLSDEQYAGYGKEKTKVYRVHQGVFG